MKTKLLFLFLCVFSYTGAVAADEGPLIAEESILTEVCKAHSLANADQTFKKIEMVRASMVDQLQNGGYGNSIQGYFILSALFAENPYRGLNALESGIKRLQKEKKPSRYQQVILQTYCENGGEVSMQLITIAP